MADGGGTYDNPSLKGDAGMRIESSGDEASSSDKALSALVTKRWKVAQTEKQKYSASWDRWRRFLGGDQWYNKLRPAWKSRPVSNHIRSTAYTIIPMMTDSKPTINVVGKNYESAVKADLMQDVVRAIFDANSMQTKYPVLLRDDFMYGGAVSKQWYNAKRDDIEVTIIDSRNFFPSPGAMTVQDMAWGLVVVNQWIDTLEREFPEQKGKIPPGTWDDALTHKPVSTQKESDGDTFWQQTNEGTLISTGAGGSEGPEKFATRIEMWERDDKGVRVCVLANGVVCKPWCYPFKHKLYPFEECVTTPVNSQLWGESEVGQLESPQDSVNRSEAQITDIVRMCASPMMTIPRGGRINLKDITNRIGGFVLHEDDKPPRWMEPAPIDGNVFQIGERAKENIKDLSGVYEAARGQLPSNKVSGVAIQSLQSATAGRVGLKTRQFENWLRRVAVQVIELAKQFYQKRVVRVGKGRFVAVNAFLKDGSPDPDSSIGDCDFDVEIGVGSTLPVDKGVRFDQDLQLFGVGAIDRQTLLEDTGRPEQQVQEIIKRLEREKIKDVKQDIKAQTMAAQAQAAAAPPPEAAPPEEAAAPAASPEDEKAAAEAEAAAGPGAAALPSDEEIAEVEQMISEAQVLQRR